MTKRVYWFLGIAVLSLSGVIVYVIEEASEPPNEPLSVPVIAGGSEQRPLDLLTLLPDLEYMDTPALRAQGLSGREFLSKSAGLLFVFETSDLHGFWMKDMRFAIDMVWLDETGIIVGLKEGASPASYPEVFYPENPARYVLETNVGFVARHDLELGDLVAVPLR